MLGASEQPTVVKGLTQFVWLARSLEKLCRTPQGSGGFRQQVEGEVDGGLFQEEDVRRGPLLHGGLNLGCAQQVHRRAVELFQRRGVAAGALVEVRQVGAGAAAVQDIAGLGRPHDGGEQGLFGRRRSIQKGLGQGDRQVGLDGQGLQRIAFVRLGHGRQQLPQPARTASWMASASAWRS